MVRETDLWQTAWIIAAEYGAEGVDFAGQMAHSFDLGGKTKEREVWVSIMEKVEALTSSEPEVAGPRQ